jgi:hypothetical protein
MRITLERGFQLFGELHSFRAATCRETADESSQACLSNLGRKVNTRDPRRRQHSSEALFGCGRFQRRAIQQQLVSGNSEQ